MRNKSKPNDLMLAAYAAGIADVIAIQAAEVQIMRELMVEKKVFSGDELQAALNERGQKIAAQMCEPLHQQIQARMLQRMSELTGLTGHDSSN